MKTAYFGFTLIELMIVIAIVAILAAIALPAYQIYTARAQLSEVFSVSNVLKTSVAEEVSERNTCPNNSNAPHFGIPKASDINSRYIAHAVTGGTTPQCRITVTLKEPGVAEALQNKQVIFTLSSVEGRYAWNCSSPDIDSIYLPSTCK